MARNEKATPKLFVDADVLFAGAASPSEHSASLMVLTLSEITLIKALTSEQVVAEAERNLVAKIPKALPAFQHLASRWRSIRAMVCSAPAWTCPPTWLCLTSPKNSFSWPGAGTEASTSWMIRSIGLPVCIPEDTVSQIRPKRPKSPSCESASLRLAPVLSWRHSVSFVIIMMKRQLNLLLAPTFNLIKLSSPEKLP
jgi:hypothetical protein